MAEVQKIKELSSQLTGRLKRSQSEDQRRINVGFTAAYAIYVHEDLEARHVVGQAKYLSDAVWRFKDVVSQLVVDAMKRGLTMEQALLIGGLRIQRESQLLVPIDTGNLKNSAFTSIVLDERDLVKPPTPAGVSS